ncbi:MAG: hypothetical protein IT480_06590 [Gammaproteobacteria bacterium]|nr:hypothetical protein [Gammaproteobacteria bacterium]
MSETNEKAVREQLEKAVNRGQKEEYQQNLLFDIALSLRLLRAEMKVAIDKISFG